jgi:hypothetical protein
MHEDDEERFPRITLWQFLVGILKTIVWFEMWPIYRWDDLQSRSDEKTAKREADEKDHQQPTCRMVDSRSSLS